MSVLRILAIVSTLLVAAVPAGHSIERAAEEENGKAPGAGADYSNAPRVDIDRPVEIVPLHLRDPRIHGLVPFQSLVDAAPAGSVLRPAPGKYAGPVLVTKPLVIEGGNAVTIDGGDKGTVAVIRANDVTMRNLHLTGSGDSHDSDDACLNVRAHRATIEGLVIDDCLFGIDLKQSNDSMIRGNRIRSKPFALGVRGDGLRLWYSHGNLIERNEIVDSRDMVAWYSNRNVFRANVGRRSRYSIHFMFAHDNVVEDNRFYDNAVGVYFMYTEGGVARRNVISHATGATGMGIGFKEASSTVIEDNELVYCAIGIGSDLSPFQPDTKIFIRGNRLAYNGIGIAFNSELGGNVTTGNVFEGNLTHVALAGRGRAGRNEWAGNWFDDYQGFDRDRDGIGDTPHELYAYADQIWMDIPAARFFKTAPVLELLDFLERLAPFSAPELQLRDATPLFVKPAAGVAS